jgi:hypothetical protein
VYVEDAMVRWSRLALGMRALARRQWTGIAVLACVAGAIGIARSSPPQEDLPNRKQLVQQAKAAQYSLLREGMESVHCTATVDWRGFLNWRGPQDDDEKATLAALEKSHYDVSIDDAGTPTVSTVEAPIPAAADSASEVRGTLAGLHRSIAGLLNAWTGYMAIAMLPRDEDDFHMTETGGKYYLKYTVEDVAIAIAMDSKFQLLRVWTKDKSMRSDVHPTFDATPKGFVLNGYQADLDDLEKNRSTQAKLTIQYETVDGLLVPQTMTETVPGQRGPDTVHFSFSDYKITKRGVR